MEEKAFEVILSHHCSFAMAEAHSGPKAFLWRILSAKLAEEPAAIRRRINKTAVVRVI